jgi:hypothetical protein
MNKEKTAKKTRARNVPVSIVFLLILFSMPNLDQSKLLLHRIKKATPSPKKKTKLRSIKPNKGAKSMVRITM